MSGIFVSHRRDDTFVAVLIADRLAANFGAASVFRDDRNVAPGTEFPPELWGRLQSSSVLLVVIGPRWLTRDEAGSSLDSPDDVVRRQIELAMRLGIHIIPVLLDDTPFPSAEDLPPSLAALHSRQFVRVRSRTVDADVAALVSQVGKVGPKPPPGPGGSAAPGGTGSGPDIVIGDTYGDDVLGDKTVGRVPPPPGPEFPTDR